MKTGDQVVLGPLRIPPRAVSQAGGNIPKATTALVESFNDHPQIKAGLRNFGIEMATVLGVKDAPKGDAPTVGIVFIAYKETAHKSSDAKIFLTGVWNDMTNTISSRKPWWKIW